MKINKRVLADVGSYLMVIGVTASITYTIVKDVYQRRQDKTIAGVREYYKKKYESDIGSYKNERKAELEEALNQEIKAETRKIFEEMPEDLVKVQNRYHSGDSSNEVTSLEELRVMELPKGDVHIITEAEFYQDDKDNQEKVSAVYYEEDDVACDQYDEVMDDYSYILGTEFLTAFVKEGRNKRAYVRNTILKTDYEIDLIESSYAKEVLGYEEKREPNRPRKFRADD